jgi:hypothetical protein
MINDPQKLYQVLIDETNQYVDVINEKEGKRITTTGKLGLNSRKNILLNSINLAIKAGGDKELLDQVKEKIKF